MLQKAIILKNNDMDIVMHASVLAHKYFSSHATLKIKFKEPRDVEPGTKQ